MNFISEIKKLVQGKKVIIYGAGTRGKILALQLDRAGVCIEKILDRDYENKKVYVPNGGEIVVSSPYDLFYMEKGTFFVLVTVSPCYENEIISFLSDMGYVKGKDYCLSQELLGKAFEIFDPFLGYSRKFENACGFEVYGNPAARYKIVALGGSTTDHFLMGIKSWAEQLQTLFKEDLVCVYNGGISGYDSSGEMLKLIRDVIPLRPDLVISYSGYNDAVLRKKKGDYPLCSYYLQTTVKQLFANGDVGLIPHFGVANDISASDLFVQNEKIMKAICDMLGISFIAILQETLFENALGTSYCMSEWEKMVFDIVRYTEDEESFYQEVVQKGCFSEWFIDGRDFLGESTNQFVDECHLTEEGNMRIAQKIYELINHMVSED